MCQIYGARVTECYSLFYGQQIFWAEGELMAAQVIQEIMNSEEEKKAAERAALRAQEAHRLMMKGPTELPYDDDYDA